MPPLENFGLFLVASLALILTPGQDFYLVMSRSLAQGMRAGVVTAAGISTGLLGHTLLVAVGLGAVIRASDTLFFVLKVAGAVYLVWLGVAAMRAGVVASATVPVPWLRPRRLFVHGALSNLVNPKIAVFYIAFLPQFVPVDVARPTASLLLLGATFALLTLLVKAPLGCAAGAMAGMFRRHPRVQAWMNRVSGAVLVALGLRLLVAEPGR